LPRTAIVFLSDNGGVSRNHRPSPRPGPDGKLRPEINLEEFPNTPLRAWKGSAYEGGIRVPMIARFPRMKRHGVVDATPVHAVDLLPTFFGLAGAAAPKGHVLDGLDFGRRVSEGRALPARDLFWYMPFYDMIWLATPSAVIRSGDWKLIEYFGDWVDGETRVYATEPRSELYNLREDLGEKTNLAARDPRRASALQAKLRQWIGDCGARLPGQNPNYDPARALDSVTGRAPA
jgi:uncharacterized sulfatase